MPGPTLCLYRSPAASWPDAIPAGQPTMLIANGLLAFLSEQEIISLFTAVTGHFESGELAFNDYGRIGWVSRAMAKLAPQRMFKAVSGQWSGYPGFKDAHRPEAWNPRLKLVEETSLAHAPEVELFPPWLRVATGSPGASRALPARRESCATASSRPRGAGCNSRS